MRKRFYRLTGLVLASVMALSLAVMPKLTVSADWIDGETPEKVENRVWTTDKKVIAPTVRTNFHAKTLVSLVPTSFKSEFDHATGVDVSLYADALTYVYVEDNVLYGEQARASLEAGKKYLGATAISTFTLNLFKYEGKAYKLIPETAEDLEFMMTVPKSVRDNAKDYAVLRLNPDGSIAVLPDLDTDSLTVTFKTNYFKEYNLYAFVYAPRGTFDVFRGI